MVLTVGQFGEPVMCIGMPVHCTVITSLCLQKCMHALVMNSLGRKIDVHNTFMLASQPK